MIKYDLYLGMRSGKGAAAYEIGEAALRSFEEEFIRTRLAGYTIAVARGFFDGVQESSRILTIVAEGDDPIIRDTVYQIAEDYKREMRQESVLVIETTVKGEFV